VTDADEMAVAGETGFEMLLVPATRQKGSDIRGERLLTVECWRRWSWDKRTSIREEEEEDMGREEHGLFQGPSSVMTDGLWSTLWEEGAMRGGRGREARQ
jgi:hypothetical protein